MAKNLVSSLSSGLADPDKEKHEQARKQATANLQRLQRRRDHEERDGQESSGDEGRGPRVEDLVLNEYENMVALEVVAPEDIPVGFDGAYIWGPASSGRMLRLVKTSAGSTTSLKKSRSR